MVENKKAVMIGLAAAGAILSAAVIFKLWRGMGEKESVQAKLVEAKLDKIKTDSNGKLDQTYFLNLLQFIGQETKRRTKDLRAVNLKARREHFKKEEWVDYEGIIKKMTQSEDIIAQATVKEVITSLDMSAETFKETHKAMASNQATAEFVMAAQQGKLQQSGDSQQPKLTKKKTLEIFEEQQELSLEYMKKVAQDGSKNETDPNAQMMSMVVDQAKMHD